MSQLSSRIKQAGLADLWLLSVLAISTLAMGSWSAWQTWGPAEIPQQQATTVSLPSQQATPPATISIQDIRVGQRVVSQNPLRDQVDDSFSEPDQATWRQLTLVMQKPDGKQLDITLLRPISWIDNLDATVGATIELNLHELGAAGPAQVLAIEPSPPIQAGTGQVVTGTFQHESSQQVLNVQIEGESEPIGTTANHPFWSEDRQQFVPAGELRQGERLRTLAGISQVVSITERGPPEPVFNLEVHGEHVYLVTSSGVLVHNACAGNPVPGKGFVSSDVLENSVGALRRQAPVRQRGRRMTSQDDPFR